MNRGVTSYSISVAAPRPAAELWIKPVNLRISFSAVAGMVILAGLMLCASVIARTHREYRAAVNSVRSTETEINRLRMENSRIRYEIESMRDPAVIETIARRDLGLVRKGEMVLIRKTSITVPAGATK